jgi:hypothetical protein
MGQVGWARYLWSPNRTDMEAVALFHTLYLKIAQLPGLQSTGRTLGRARYGTCRQCPRNISVIRTNTWWYQAPL